MNLNEMLWSTATTAITATQLIENSQCQVLTHDYLYTISRRGSKIQFGPDLTPSTMEKKHLVLEMILQGTTWGKNIPPPPMSMYFFPQKWDGEKGS